ncbi:GTP-binding protein [Paenalcaligenes niemegkensis]|uniref:sulfate adenylyltransferase subunit 1 n=1 Tax=Paenalcaligenes niemegkensis TaxID=2895469 RepID=UPI001EE92372|nr:GTP-binding protein [Paenalcaligenes niemegkensis]MCQ9615328.1 GTP-binding protein [Paenalcaligenes niemegkensis]
MNAINESWVSTTDTGVLRFITAGSVDDGKSTLIGRLLLDSQAVFADQIDAINRSKYKRTNGHEPDLALLTDGLEAEREQGITIDVAYRYFATPSRKFIVADAPGHEQYTRNMITGASTAQAVIILIDASKARDGRLLTQTRRHTTLAKLLGVKHIVVAINKMDLVGWDEAVFNRIQNAYSELANQVGISSFQVVPISALQGDNISKLSPFSPWYEGLPLLGLLESLSLADTSSNNEARLFVQWVIRHDGQAANAFRGYAGHLDSGSLHLGDEITVWPSKVSAKISALQRSGSDVQSVQAGDAVTVLLDRDIDVSRGDLIALATNAIVPTRDIQADLCWLDENPLNPARSYWLKQGSRVTQAKVKTIHQVRDIEALEPRSGAERLEMNDIASVSLSTRDALILEPYETQPTTGAFILIDSATHQTAAAGIVR